METKKREKERKVSMCSLKITSGSMVDKITQKRKVQIGKLINDFA